MIPFTEQPDPERRVRLFGTVWFGRHEAFYRLVVFVMRSPLLYKVESSLEWLLLPYVAGVGRSYLLSKRPLAVSHKFTFVSVAHGGILNHVLWM